MNFDQVIIQIIKSYRKQDMTTRSCVNKGGSPTGILNDDTAFQLSKKFKSKKDLHTYMTFRAVSHLKICLLYFIRVFTCPANPIVRFSSSSKSSPVVRRSSKWMKSGSTPSPSGQSSRLARCGAKPSKIPDS